MNDRVIRDAGTADAEWLFWLAQQNIQRLELNDLYSSHSRLVVIAPHPDDEILACGGLLASWAKQGFSIQMIAVTDGEASHGTQNSAARARLGTCRVAESYAGLHALGVLPSSAIRLSIPDGKVSEHMPALVSRLQTMLQPHDLVVTTWRLDGHPDHEAASTATAQSCLSVRCRLLQAPVWMWHWGSPGDTRVPWANLVALDLQQDIIALKQQALRYHRSQLLDRSNGLGPVLVPSIVERVARCQEYFFL